MIETADRAAREKFACALDQNFSVIASAGSGKTRAITDRILRIAQDRHAREWLPQLVVVTYTNRAADEMQQRTRQRILEAGLPLEVIEAFSRAFFGTIHSFCVKLLAAHGHHLGLPANLELITDDDDLWNQFVQQQMTIGRSLSEENRRVLLRHMQVRQLMELARKHDVDLSSTQPETPCPDADFSEVYAAVAQGQTLRTIPRAKKELENWDKRWRETREFVPWPPCTSSAREFVRRWREAFRPLREWVNACALCVAAEVQRDYREFRLERGMVTYWDQIALAAELLRLPDVAKRIREKNYRVILDEAQDTDPQQFFVLLESARPPEATEEWRQDRHVRAGLVFPPRGGHFCMVGDLQQSIYREPADLARYRRLHESLVESGAAAELKFSVTFRLDQAQFEFVNATFGEILNNLEDQVEFIELNPRPDVLPGQVIRFDLGEDVDLALPETRRATMEARQLATWLSETGFEKLRANSWRDVAILCPRKAWLRAMRDALVDVDLPVEVQSESDREGENPAYAWLTALLAVIVDPHASYEIAGVLREVFGISDDELARFANGDGERFQIAERTRGRGIVNDALNLLTQIRAAIEHQPLFTGVQEMIRVTRLRERLRSLPVEEFGELSIQLDKLLGQAAAEEARGSSLAEFAQTLRMNFETTRETHPSSADAIQLITAHKAKGSEWQAVIVPFLAREVGMASARYPRIIENDGAQIVFDRTDLAEAEESIKRTERQEMERLLYVALTRAKHTLVLAFDRQFFLSSRGKVQDNTQLKWLRGDNGDANAAVIAALSTETQTCAETMAVQGQKDSAPATEDFRALQLDTGWIDIARQRAATFIHTMTPSKFAPEEEVGASEEADEWKEIEPELRPARVDNPATRYGVWWHDFAQRLSWSADANSWEKIFAAQVAASPDPARSKREWALLQQQLGAAAPLRKQINSAAATHAELPFFWRVDARRCLEGIVDLALFDAATKKTFIIDWKTNRIGPDKIDNLRAQYRPQMAAYWRAMTELTDTAVDAAIYSTANGQLIIYEQNELATEWDRIVRLTPPWADN